MSVEKTSDKVAGKAKEAIAAGAAKLDQAVDTSAEATKRTSARLRQSVDDFVNDYSDVYEEGSDALENALVCAKNVVRTHPITSLALVGALGYLLGRMR